MSFPAGLPVKIWKAFLPSSILTTFPAHLNVFDYRSYTLTEKLFPILQYLLKIYEPTQVIEWRYVKFEMK